MKLSLPIVTNDKLIKIAVIFLLTTQINHCATLFYDISKEEGFLIRILSYIFAFGLEISIYIFTINGKKMKTLFFSLISFFINILYYWYTFGFTRNFCAMVVISAIIPIATYLYSSLIDEKRFANEPIDEDGNIRRITLNINEDGTIGLKKPVGRLSNKATSQINSIKTILEENEV